MKRQDDTCAAVKASLSEYMDGTLAPDQNNTVQEHLNRCQACMNVYIGLRHAQRNLTDTLEGDSEIPELKGMWDNISSQLQDDKVSAVACRTLQEVYSEEFVSTYYDGEMSKDLPEFNAFESHLSACTVCTELLGDIQESSEQMRQFSYRLEESCTLDLTAHVMALLEGAATEDMPAEDTIENSCPDMDVVNISAFIDMALSRKESLEVTKHLEGCAICKETILGFTLVEEQMAALTKTISEQVPDFRPQMRPKIKKLVEENRKKIVPFYKNPRLTVPVSAVAAVLLIFLVFPLDQVSDNEVFAPSEQEQNVAAAPVNRQLAALPKKQKNKSDIKSTFERDKVFDEVQAVKPALPALKEEEDIAVSTDDAILRENLPVKTKSLRRRDEPHKIAMAGGNARSAGLVGSGTFSEGKRSTAASSSMAFSPAPGGLEKSAIGQSKKRSEFKDASYTPSSEEYMFMMNNQDLSADSYILMMGY